MTDLLVIPTPGTLEEQVSVLYKRVESEAERRWEQTYCYLPTKKANGHPHHCPDKDACHQDGVCRNYSGREYESMLAEEMLRILDEVECVSAALRGKVIEIIQRKKLFTVNYESLEQMLEARTQLSSGEASNYNRLSEVVFPFLEKNKIASAVEVWQRVGRSKLRLITAPIAEIIASDAKDKVEQVADLIETAEAVSWRELWRQTSGSKIPTIRFEFKRYGDGQLEARAFLTEQQFELLRRRFSRHAQFEEVL